MRSLATLQKCTRAKNEPHLFFCFVVVVASTMKLAEVLLVILIPASFAQHHDFIKVDTPSKQFIDSTGEILKKIGRPLVIFTFYAGRARLFHGVNVVSHVNFSLSSRYNAQFSGL